MSAVPQSRYVRCETPTVCECLHACKNGPKREEARLLVGVVDVDPAVTLESSLGHLWIDRELTLGQPWVNLGEPRVNRGHPRGIVAVFIKLTVAGLMRRCHIYIYVYICG